MLLIEKGLKVLIVFSTFMLTVTFSLPWFFAKNNEFINRHLFIAIPTSILVFFSSTCVLFYFIGTSVWMRDKSENIYFKKQKKQTGYQLNQIYLNANKLKARTFPFATMIMGFTIFTFIFGGGVQVKAAYSWIHPALAFLTLIFQLLATKTYIKYININIDFLNEFDQVLHQESAN